MRKERGEREKRGKREKGNIKRNIIPAPSFVNATEKEGSLNNKHTEKMTGHSNKNRKP